MGASLQSAYHNTMPAGISERGELYWTNARNELNRDFDLPAVIKFGKYKMWYQNDIPDRPDGGPVFESRRERVYFKNGVPHRENNPAILINGPTPISPCSGSDICDCQYNYGQPTTCEPIGYRTEKLYAYTIPDLKEYCGQFSDDTKYAYVYYKNGKLHNTKDGYSFYWKNKQYVYIKK